jgi:hypothetical protein
MENQNNLNELNMDYATYSKVKGKMNPQDRKSVTITGDKPATSSSSMSMASTMEENEMSAPEAVIEPQDKATIQYLSNVKDANTGEISQPSNIGDKKYQMVRGIKPSKEIVMAVFCHDELNESGENVIHPIEHFEKTIVQPIMEKEAMMQQEVMFGNDIEEKVEPKVESKKRQESLNLSEFKHYLVNEKSGKFRKFKKVLMSSLYFSYP